MRGIIVAIFFTVIFIVSCDGSNREENICYILTSSNPCFDPNTGGSTTIVTDQSLEEVISDLENMEGFIMELEITNILETRAFVGEQPPDCPYEQSTLVIKTANDWNRFRNSCFFSFFDLPDVNFENEMVLVSTQEILGLGTKIEASLEFDDNLSVVIEDDVTDIPPPAPGFPINIVSVDRMDLPVDFFRVENDLTP
ncbi:MAG: hypothetical protein E4H21_11095 [Thermodesulfobacteriales bacterium]|nr:MAG: hypothetical protein E4H21_11095 [Thermodesulfobacteriales bacterium]